MKDIREDIAWAKINQGCDDESGKPEKNVLGDPAFLRLR